jgi:hypothetical protein
MSKVGVFLLISALTSLTGCAGVVSLHPLAGPNGKDTVFDLALLGTWVAVNPQGDGARTRFAVARAESGYSVIAGPDEIKGTVQLIRADSRTLLDAYYPSKTGHPAVHLFFKLRLEKDTAWVAEMESDWLRGQIRSRGELRHEVLAEDGDRIVLTASPAELRRYLLPYAADDRSFGEETELRRIK